MNIKRLASIGAVAGLAAIGVAAVPQDAHAWCCSVGIGIAVPTVVVAPPVYAPPVYVPPPVAYVPPPGPVYVAPRRVWVPPHWQGRYWIRGHWS